MKLLNITAALMIASTPAFAQSTTSTSNGTGQASSTVNQYSEGSRIAPAIGAYGGNNTAACIKSYGAGITGLANGIPLGFGVSIPKEIRDCMAPHEAQALLGAMNIKNPHQRKIALYHLCKNTKRIRETMIATGVCKVRK